MMRKLLPLCAVLFALGGVNAQAGERSPIVYNFQGNMVGVIQRTAPNGDAIMLPSKATVDLGYYDVAVPARALRPRPKGGWEIALSNDQIAYLPPVPYRFWQSSGN